MRGGGYFNNVTMKVDGDDSDANGVCDDDGGGGDGDGWQVQYGG